MKKGYFIIFILLFICTPAFSQVTDSISYGKFGKITIYKPVGVPTSVALFVSGSGGWNSGVFEMAKNLANQGALVVGIDARHYEYYLSKVKDDCLYPAGDFEVLSMDIQKKYKLTTYHKPVLVGYSYGAVLVYGILAQAPANTFKGAIALGFCPDITMVKPMCKGNGLTQHVLKPGKSYYLEATKTLTAPFIVLNGVKDLTCPFNATATFLKDMPMAELITLYKVGHGFKVGNNWLADYNAAYKRIVDGNSTEAKNTAAESLPLTIVSAAKKNSLPFVFMISGDGGWTSFDQSLAEALANKGLYVVGLDAQKYFWNEKTPDNTAAEINRVIMKYQEQFGKKNFILAGYSFGASVVPFLATRLSTDIEKDLKGVVSLSPDGVADFEIHISDMLNFGKEKGKYNVVSEMKKIKGLKPFCIFGKDEDDEDKAGFSKGGIKVINIPGNHHYDKDYQGIATLISGIAD
ncbi:type IV secretory pathway VirJ component [Pedobacter sp. UYP24]